MAKETTFKDILALAGILFSLIKFGRGHHEEHICEIIMRLDQWFMRRCPLKIFLILSYGGPFVPGNGTICSILVGHYEKLVN